MAFFGRIVYFLAALWICSSVLAAPLEEAVIYASASRLQLGQQVALGVKATTPVFMALIVGAISPDGTIVSVVNTTTLGVNIDLIGTMGESEDGSGLSQVFNKACIDGGDMDVSVPYLPNVVGRWRFSYAILHYFPAAGGDYTYENGKVCLSQPISGESMMGGYISIDVISGEDGTTSLPDSQLSDAPIATSDSTALPFSFSNTPTGELSDFPFSSIADSAVPSSSTSSPATMSQASSSSSTRRFKAKFYGQWSLMTFFTILLRSGLY